MRLDFATRHKIAHNLLHGCTVVSMDVQVVAQAMAVEATYQVSYWDALVVSAAKDCVLPVIEQPPSQ